MEASFEMEASSMKQTTCFIETSRRSAQEGETWVETSSGPNTAAASALMSSRGDQIDVGGASLAAAAAAAGEKCVLITGSKPTIGKEREFFIDNLLVRIHFIIVMMRWTCLAPWEFEFPFPGSLTSTFLSLSRGLTKVRNIFCKRNS